MSGRLTVQRPLDFLKRLSDRVYSTEPARLSKGGGGGDVGYSAEATKCCNHIAAIHRITLIPSLLAYAS